MKTRNVLKILFIGIFALAVIVGPFLLSTYSEKKSKKVKESGPHWTDTTAHKGKRSRAFCKEGYKFIITENGFAVQIFEKGRSFHSFIPQPMTCEE